MRKANRFSGRFSGNTISSQILARQQLKQQLTDSIELSDRWEVPSLTPASAVTCLHIDPIQDRFLLAGFNSARLALYDLEMDQTKGSQGLEDENSMAQAKLINSSKKHSTRTPNGGHKFTVSRAMWYPVDLGMFVSASLDQSVKVWDSSSFEAVCTFQLGARVHAMAMSPNPNTHCLIGASSSNVIRLCDISTGNFTHTLSGHSSGILTLAWSPTEEYILASAGLDHQIRIWDIRKSGSSACLSSLDMYAQSEAATTIGATYNLSGMELASESELGRVELEQLGRKRKRQRTTGLAPRMAGPNAPSSSMVTAHNAPVKCILFTQDGQRLVSSGADSTMRLWRRKQGNGQFTNTHTHYEDIAVDGQKKTLQFTLMETAVKKHTVVFHPQQKRGHTSILAHRLYQGGPPCRPPFAGHFQNPNCVQFRKSVCDLISGGDDGLILVWQPRLGSGNRFQQEELEDEWSD